MKKNIIGRLTQSLLFASSVGLTVCQLDAAELKLLGTNMPSLDFHGFVSQGFMVTSEYNYLADNTKSGSFEFFEAGLNVSMNPLPRTHITAQGFMYDVGDSGNYQPFLDYASIEYTFSDYIGVRGGRIRKPSGIYNHIQDVDLARTYVLLPQGIYDARWRDFTTSVDGGEFFGNIPLSKAGDLSYEVYAGFLNIATDSGVANFINNRLMGGYVTSFDPATEVGSQIWWNTPINGLRFGAAFGYAFNFNYDFREPTGAPPPFASSISLRAKSSLPVQQYSAEYLWKNWTFQAEYYNVQVSQDTTSPFGTTHSFVPQEAWYGGAAYRFNKWLEAGGYYTEFYTGAPATVSSDSSQKDAALSFRFDPTDWWIIKVEGHVIRGTALLQDNASNPIRNDDAWFMLAVKTTFSF
ncbi:MAG: hypothetical protein WDM80_15680 [Limisphaerales bacterium]